jgi:hypothetical protein
LSCLKEQTLNSERSRRVFVGNQMIRPWSSLFRRNICGQHSVLDQEGWVSMNHRMNGKEKQDTESASIEAHSWLEWLNYSRMRRSQIKGWREAQEKPNLKDPLRKSSSSFNETYQYWSTPWRL